MALYYLVLQKVFKVTSFCQSCCEMIQRWTYSNNTLCIS